MHVNYVVAADAAKCPAVSDNHDDCAAADSEMYSANDALAQKLRAPSRFSTSPEILAHHGRALSRVMTFPPDAKSDEMGTTGHRQQGSHYILGLGSDSLFPEGVKGILGSNIDLCRSEGGAGITFLIEVIYSQDLQASACSQH